MHLPKYYLNRQPVTFQWCFKGVPSVLFEEVRNPETLIIHLSIRDLKASTCVATVDKAASARRADCRPTLVISLVAGGRGDRRCRYLAGPDGGGVDYSPCFDVVKVVFVLRATPTERVVKTIFMRDQSDGEEFTPVYCTDGMGRVGVDLGLILDPDTIDKAIDCWRHVLQHRYTDDSSLLLLLLEGGQ
ncbi:hypothetical protein EVAR_14456_1 [Eumeta japonica]|uniref:Uncharacterized protein n=1 Tax=Eumeta variegata TaxID=151549 RepID=A0A4C1U359_EUMVA|nr:hypothetical protein EVAR_14456_1 [Eumeta japonica]